MLHLLTFTSSPVLPVFVFLLWKMALKRKNLVLQDSVLILKYRAVAALAFVPCWFIISWWWCRSFDFYGLVRSWAFSYWTSRRRTFGDWTCRSFTNRTKFYWFNFSWFNHWMLNSYWFSRWRFNFYCLNIFCWATCAGSRIHRWSRCWATRGRGSSGQSHPFLARFIDCIRTGSAAWHCCFDCLKGIILKRLRNSEGNFFALHSSGTSQQ